MADKNAVIRSLWVGSELSPSEVLSINSYLQNGHELELYVYDHVRNVPSGVTLRDAGQIVPRSEVFAVPSGPHKSSYAIFSDLFRYRLLYEVGGWWSDLDAVCVKHFDLDQEYVFMQEKQKGKRDRVCNGVIKSPASAPCMRACYHSARGLAEGVQSMEWAATGPLLLGRAVDEYGLNRYVVPAACFSPIGWYEIEKLLAPFAIDEATYSIHLYNEVWRMRSMSKYGIYPRDSILGELKRRYSVPNDYLGLMRELLADVADSGVKKGLRTVYNKAWHMYKAHQGISVS